VISWIKKGNKRQEPRSKTKKRLEDWRPESGVRRKK